MAKGKKREYTEKELRWLERHYKHTKNEEIVAKLGISASALHRIASKMGLSKSKQFMAKCQRESTEASIASNLRNGTYPPKGYAIPNREANYFRKGETMADRLGKKRASEIVARAAESRRKTWRSERARAAFGLPQRTKLRVVPVPKRKVALRWYLKKRGYIVDDEKRIVYYTTDTKRGKRIEAKKQPWYKFEPLERGDNLPPREDK